MNIAVTKNNEDDLLAYEEIWEGIKNEFKKINDGKDGKYDKNYRKVKFNCGDDLPLNEILKFQTLTLVVGRF